MRAGALLKPILPMVPPADKSYPIHIFSSNMTGGYAPTRAFMLVVSPNALRRLLLAPWMESQLEKDPTKGMGAVAATLGGRLRLLIERFLSSENGSLMKLDRLRFFSGRTRSSLSSNRCPRSVASAATAGVEGYVGTGFRYEEAAHDDPRLVIGR